ncbi:hypothetical protein VB796_19885 [Arcicella sp. LKC2W]|uniref:hypothetical protein n=1 Tax=Arcicella sp. LKC2W TaxID=2984198 RepID=UPI002B21A003|nr:hypothetical protein [Arcicella sp. LKC2W]MEA5461335.1 hypothetical protein [Arcicella sp. LKC2W]
MLKLLKIAHLLSLDVVFGAMVCNIMFWKLSLSNAQIPISIILILGFSVWIIYILDRLLDNQKPSQVETERHFFHQKHRKVLTICLFISIVFCAILLFYLPYNILILGILTTAITTIYLYLTNRFSAENHFQHYKEPITATVYTMGVFSTTVLNDFSMPSLFVGILFLLITFQNLLLFSLSELKKNPECHNLASYWGTKNSHKIIILISVVVMSIGFYWMKTNGLAYFSKVFFIEILMSFILLIISLFNNIFLTNDRYRWVGDGIFLLPLFIIF